VPWRWKVHVANVRSAAVHCTGYSVHRGGAVEIEGAEDPLIRNVVFDSPGGNGLLLSGYVRGARVEQSEFKWVGDSAIVLLGRTDPAQPCNGSNGEQPRGTQIVGNFIHEVPFPETLASA
jgi:hypothetical protein